MTSSSTTSATGEDDQVVLRTGRPTLALLELTPWAVGRGEDLPGLQVTAKVFDPARRPRACVV